MKVVILGLDALDYEYVKEGDFPNLKQKEYGKVSLAGIAEIATFPIWTTFITGTLPSEHRVVHQQKPARGLRGILKRVLPKIRLGRPEVWIREDIKTKTIFERIPDSIAVSVPIWSKHRFLIGMPYEEVSKLLGTKHEWKIKEDILKTHLDEQRYVEKLLRTQSFKMLMAHFWTLDYCGHYFFSEENYLDSIYSQLDKMVGDFRKLVNDCLFIIVSDHGMEQVGKFGYHSPYGFYSLNRSLGLNRKPRKPHMTEFADLIVEAASQKAVKRETKEKELLFDQLKSLGYF